MVQGVGTDLTFNAQVDVRQRKRHTHATLLSSAKRRPDTVRVHGLWREGPWRWPCAKRENSPRCHFGALSLASREARPRGGRVASREKDASASRSTTLRVRVAVELRPKERCNSSRIHP